MFQYIHLFNELMQYYHLLLNMTAPIYVTLEGRSAALMVFVVSKPK